MRLGDIPDGLNAAGLGNSSGRTAPGSHELAEATMRSALFARFKRETDADIAEDFNLGGRGH